MEEKDTQFAEVAKLFGLVLNQYRLYSENHPAAQLAIRNLFAALDPILRSEPMLSLGLVEGKMIVNDCPLDDKKTGVPDLRRECQRLGIESLTFEQGVSEEEMSSFFRVMAIPPKALEEKGGFRKAFEEASFQHIRLENARYRMVKEEEIVTTLGSGAEGAVPERVRRIERMEQVIEYYLTGSEEAAIFDTGRLGYEVERSPKAVAAAMIRRALDLEVLKRIVEGVASFLREHLAPPYIQEGKDFSQPIYALAIEFKKILKEVGIKGAGDLVFMLERCADAVKVELMVRAFEEDDQATLAKMARLCRKGAREKLQERLADLGVEEGVIEKLLAERRAPHRSRKVHVSSEELEELRRIRDRFQEELAHRLQQETAGLEREKERGSYEKGRVDKIIRNVGGAMVVIDVEGKIQFVNPAAERLLGLSRGEGSGVAVAKVLRDDHLLALAKGPLRDGAGWVTREIELKGEGDETLRFLQASTAIIEDEDGQTVGMLSVLNDITKQKSDNKGGAAGAG
jgi:PAS domain S-box-containing protein